MIGTRLRAIVVKEMWAILRDPRARLILIAPPLMQMLLFGFASTMEVTNVRIGVLDLDGGRWSRAVVERLAGSPTVKEVVALRSDTELRQAIDRQRVIGALRFDAGFSGDVAAGRGGTIGAVYDGRRSNAAQIVSSYVDRIAGEVGAEVSPRAIQRGQTYVRALFNPNLIDLWFVMPALIAIIAAVSAMTVVSQSVARERELGTFDQLMVSPLRTHEIFIGKMMPPVLVGLANVTLFMVMVPLAFGVPLTGSVTAFYFALVFYLVALSGLGMLISCVSATQQQAFLGMFALVVPLVILSGYASPVDNMPPFFRAISRTNPASWFLDISEGVFLKSMGVAEVLDHTWPIALIAVVTTTAAAMLFRSRME
ncbi:MAG TPA: ABC transporter permease [Novosphingobium sp.]|nr:ABC transporter permease [Novosphingobium sp.]